MFARGAFLIGILVIYFLFVRGRTNGFVDEIVQQYGAKKAWLIVIVVFTIFVVVGYLFGFSGSPLNGLDESRGIRP